VGKSANFEADNSFAYSSEFKDAWSFTARHNGAMLRHRIYFTFRLLYYDRKSEEITRNRSHFKLYITYISCSSLLVRIALVDTF
jgi:hypothetical protein